MKKEYLKKLLSLAIVLSTSIGILAGCGNEQPKTEESETSSAVVSTETSTTSTEIVEEQTLEPVTLKWYLSATELEGSKDVEEAFNEKLAEVLPNTTVEFTYVADYKANWPLFMAGEEKIDIAWAGYNTPFLEDCVDGNLLPIDDLMEEFAPNLVEEQEIWSQAFASAVYEGELYGIPNIQPIVSETQYFRLQETFSKYIDLDAFIENIRSTKKITPEFFDIVDEGIQKAIDEGVFKVGDLSWGPSLDIYYAVTRGYMMIGPEKNRLWYDPEAEHPTVMYLWEIPEFKLVTEKLAEWYDKGWITESQALGQVPEGSIGTIGFSSKWNANWGGTDSNGFEEIESDPENYYKVRACRPEEGYVGMVNFGNESSYTVIPYTAENPERAMMLLNILHDEPGTVGNDLINMLCYGFAENSDEAKKYGWFNYKITEEDGQPMTDKSVLGDRASMQNVANWTVGNTYKTMHDGTKLTKTAAKEYALSYYDEIFPKLTVTPVANMIVDFVPVTEKQAVMQTVYEEYNDQFMHAGGGSEKLKSLYEAAMDKMKKAGLDDVKAEIQKQIDAYIAK